MLDQKIRGLLTSFVVLVASFGCHRDMTLSTLKMGTQVDNGGDTITCRHDPELQAAGGPYFEGIFTLDYFLTMDPRVGRSDDLEGEDWGSLHGQITRFIGDKLPALASSFAQYSALLESGDDSQFRVWKATDLGLSDLRDEGLIQQLPRNCVISRGGETVADLQQMVRRRYVAEAAAQKIFYYYDFAKLAHLKNNLPLQFSYLAVHEWLWDFVDSPWVNRSINRLIHSKAGQQLSADQFLTFLRSMGLKVSGDGFIGVDGRQEAATRNQFQQSRFCQYEQRFAAEFLSASQYVVLQPREEKVLKLKVPDDEQSVVQKLCGTALMLSHRTIGSSAGATLSLQLNRGVAPYRASIAVGPVLLQSSHLGICADRLCALRDGPLQQMIYPENFEGSTWQLRLTNDSNSAAIEVRMPYLLFVQKRD